MFTTTTTTTTTTDNGQILIRKAHLRIFDPLISLIIISRVTNDNSEHLCALVSLTCFRVLGTLLYLHGHCPYITHYCFFCQEFYNNFTKMLAVSIDLQHSYCNIVFLIIQFKFCLYIFCTKLKGFIFNNCF